MNFNLFNQYVNVMLYDVENKKEIVSIEQLVDEMNYQILLSLNVENDLLKELFINREKLIIGDVFMIDGSYHLFHLNTFKENLQVKYDGFCFYHIRPEYFNKYKESNPVSLYYFLKHSEDIKSIEYKGNIYENDSLFKELNIDIVQFEYERFLTSNMILISNIPKVSDDKRKKIISKDYIYNEKDNVFMNSFFKKDLTFEINHNSLKNVCLNDLLALKKELDDEHFNYFFIGLNDLGYIFLKNHSNEEIVVASDIYYLINNEYKFLSKYDVDSIYYYCKSDLAEYKNILFYTLSSE